LLVKGAGRPRKRDRAFVTSVGIGRRAIGAAPQHLSEAQRAAWREVVASVPAGHLTASDAGTLEAYCVALDVLRRLSESFNGHRRRALH
jgi:phage terminase small subunit